MTLFIVVASLMTLASWWLVVRPLLRKPVPAPSPADALRQQIAQLDALHQSGALPAEHHRDSRAALERKLFETSGADAAAPAGRPYGLLVMVALLLAGVTAGGYRLVGTPAALGPLAVGLVHDATAAWAPALGLLLALSVVQLAVGIAAGREATVRA